MARTWKDTIRDAVDAVVERNDPAWGRRYGRFLRTQVERLHQRFGDVNRPVPAPNPYRVAAQVLRGLGFSTYRIADMLQVTQSAVVRMLRK